MNDRYLSVSEICTYLGIKRDTVYKWIDKKEFPAHRVGKFWKFKISEVDQWVKSNSNNN
jgi:excisionase family DNA binding protein